MTTQHGSHLSTKSAGPCQTRGDMYLLARGEATVRPTPPGKGIHGTGRKAARMQGAQLTIGARAIIDLLGPETSCDNAMKNEIRIQRSPHGGEHGT